MKNNNIELTLLHGKIPSQRNINQDILLSSVRNSANVAQGINISLNRRDRRCAKKMGLIKSA
ncbi:hypothetical protein CBJ86_000221 [Salmonella enterica subsp. enterica serovar Gateshead]|nr:hypothetical protein [Salmonella enterica subsp. enterica serovar Gateshead]